MCRFLENKRSVRHKLSCNFAVTTGITYSNELCQHCLYSMRFIATKLKDYSTLAYLLWYLHRQLSLPIFVFILIQYGNNKVKPMDQPIITKIAVFPVLKLQAIRAVLVITTQYVRNANCLAKGLKTLSFVCLTKLVTTKIWGLCLKWEKENYRIEL